MNCTDREAALAVYLINGELRPRNEKENTLAKNLKEIFNDTKKYDKKTEADVFYIDEKIYIPSGKEAKKADRLRSKFFDTKNSFYSIKLQELVERTCEPFAIGMEVDENNNRTLQKVNIIG
ncbi:MAG: hypothetical protein IJY61_08690 [Candidatus Gastranaerophilales bacterium]|nr:hypothetical protein [Candidatus Gastranaerophilales bacterium]